MHEYQANLIKIVDGDTLDADIDLGFSVWVRKRVRLVNIDTWESRTRDKEEKKRGLAAKARLKELIKENKNQFILISHGLSKFGRVLGEILLDDDRNVNDILIEEGHAYEYHGGNKEEARAKAQAILSERNKD